MKFIFVFFLLSFYTMNASAKIDNVDFHSPAGKKLGSAEVFFSWFLSLPAFRFKLEDMKPGTYRLAMHDGDSCKNFGPTSDENNPLLKAWKTSKLLIFEVKEDGKLNIVLHIKPEIYTEETRALLSVESLKGHPLMIFELKNNDPVACGILPI